MSDTIVLPDDSLSTPATGDDLPTVRLGEAATAGSPPPRDIDPDTSRDGVEPETEPVNPLAASAAAFLAAAAAGWMLGGIFEGLAPSLLAVTAAALGAGMVGIGYRVDRLRWLQAAALPGAVVLGGLLALGDATQGLPQLPRFVVEAIFAGGLSQPPVAFDPGWRIILVVLIAAVAVASATGAVAFNRSRVAIALPAPIIIGGVLLQPPGSEVLSVAVSLALYVAALAVVYGGELAAETDTGGARFEVRRLGRAAGLLVGITALMVGLAQLGFLFPAVPESDVIPPKRPETPREVPADRVLYTVESQRNVPLRLGVLDVYDDNAWMTPPFEPARLVDVTGPLEEPRPDAETFEIAIEVGDIGLQREVPTVAGAVNVTDPLEGLQYDPRTRSLRVQARVRPGSTYTIAASVPADAETMKAAGEPGPDVAEFLTVPSLPPLVREVLQEIPPGQPAYERLQYVRNRFFEEVVAAGVGNPVDVPPERVVEMLQGGQATPYEITAAEVLLARWVGVPARIGFGYFDPEAGPGVREIRPAHGAMWLEAWFEGPGWVPIIGRPQQARASLDDDIQQESDILPSGELATQLYIPVRQTSLLQFYTVVQYWLARILPGLAGLLALWLFVPGLIKGVRTQWRRRWADARGPRARIAVAYADFRDRAIDLNLGHPSLTPLEFLDVVQQDADHVNFAWLVTRALWGDLARDLRDEDAEAAESAGRSLAKRLAVGQPFIQRTLAYGSRVSLRQPWSTEVPNLWWQPHLRRRVRAVGRRLRAGLDLRRWLRRGGPVRRRVGLSRASLMTLIILALGLSACIQDVDLAALEGVATPMPVIPTEAAGYTLEVEDGTQEALEAVAAQALIGDLALYSIRDGGLTVGTLQVAAFKPGLDSRRREALNGVLGALGGELKVAIVGGERLYTIQVNRLRLLVWFAEDGRTYQVLAAGPEFENPDAAFVAIISAARGDDAPDMTQIGGVAPRDIRRGTP